MIDRKLFLKLLIFTLCLNLFIPLSAFQVGGGRLHGSVEDEEGNPLEGVKIFLQFLEGSKLSLQGESDEEGKWYVTGVVKGNFRITASKTGFESVDYERTLSRFTSKNPPLQIKMRKTSELDEASIMDEASLGLFHEGRALFKQRKFAEALSKFKEFLEKNYAVYQVNLNIGNCYREMGEYDNAITAYQKILDRAKKRKDTIEGNETAAKALANIGEIYLIQGDMLKSLEYLKKAIDSFPENEAVAFKVAEIFFRQGDTDQAIKYFNLAVKINESWPAPYRQLGYAYLNKGEYQKAINSLKKFLELAPENPEAENIKNLIPSLEELIKR